MPNQRLQPAESLGDTVGSTLHSYEAMALVATQADKLPPQPIIDALAGIYFQYLYHRIPVVNHSDLATPCSSTLLQQSVCLAGSVLRHPRTKNEASVIQREKFYANAKFLFYTNHEKDPMNVLKSLCLFTMWNVTPPSVITFDCSWSWLGLALRLASQMGLHKESTYAKRSDPGAARRVAWFLYAHDKLHATCFGRPQMLRDDDFDLLPPTSADFEENEVGQAQPFIWYTELASIIGKISLIQNKQRPQASQEVLSTLSLLRDWSSAIGSDLKIFDEHGSLIYDRRLFEVLIWYFTCLITFFHIHGPYFHPSVSSTISLVASSCAIRLYQEMDYRDDVNYLAAISNWSMMVVLSPQLNDIARKQHSGVTMEDNPDSRRAASQEFDILLGILASRTVKFPGAQALVDKLSDLRKQAQLGVAESVEPLAPTIDPGGYLTVHELREYFPFPESFAPRMELLQTLETDEYLTDFGVFPEWSFETLMDMGNMDAFL